MSSPAVRCALLLSIAAVLVLVAGCVEESSSPPPASAQALAWQRHPDSPLIAPGFEVWPGGPRGVAVADPTVLYDDGEQKWKMWFATFWNDPSFGNQPRLGVKYAESGDGVRWAVQPGLALEPGANASDWDYTNTETPSVVKDPSAPADRRYKLWYSGANYKTSPCASKGPGYDTLYSIGMAVSPDGKRFRRISAAESPYGVPGLVLKTADALAPGYLGMPVTRGVLADPEAVLKDGKLYLWFSSIALADCETVAAGISHATSTDGLRWTRHPDNPLPTLHRPDRVSANAFLPAQPSVLWNPEKGLFEMWFNNDGEGEPQRAGVPAKEHATLGYWHATSADGANWVPDYTSGRDFAWNHSSDFEKFGLAVGTEVAWKDGEYRMYYTAFGDRKLPAGWMEPWIWALNLATRR